MPDVGLIVGASLMGVGGLSVLYGTIMCYKSPVSVPAAPTGQRRRGGRGAVAGSLGHDILAFTYCSWGFWTLGKSFMLSYG